MKVYRENMKSGNDNIEIINNEFLYEKARQELMEFPILLEVEIMRMMFK